MFGYVTMYTLSSLQLGFLISGLDRRQVSRSKAQKTGRLNKRV